MASKEGNSCTGCGGCSLVVLLVLVFGFVISQPVPSAIIGSIILGLLVLVAVKKKKIEAERIRNVRIIEEQTSEKLIKFRIMEMQKNKEEAERIRKIEQEEVERIRKSGIAEIDLMTGIEFELYLAHLFQGLGYSVELTPASRDYGADLILYSDERKTVVQAKCYSLPVTNKAVQEVYSAKDFYEADEAWVVTNARYTPHAVNTASKLRVTLIGREDLINLAADLDDQ